jgi:hypothetical protein
MNDHRKIDQRGPYVIDSAARPSGIDAAEATAHVAWYDTSATGPINRAMPEEMILAKREITLRRRRERLLGREFGLDAPWHMMLDLLVAEGEGRQVSVTSASLSAGGAPSSGLRIVSRMIEAGLVSKTPDPDDGRRSWVQLTTFARSRLMSILNAHPRAGNSPRSSLHN